MVLSVNEAEIYMCRTNGWRHADAIREQDAISQTAFVRIY